MPVYLVRPQAGAGISPLNLRFQSLTPEKRLELIEEQGDIWTQQKSYQDLEKWIEDKKDVRRVVMPRLSSSVGLIAADIPEERVEDLRQEGVSVIRGDISIDLVSPLKAEKNAFKTSLDPEDLWHLEITKIQELRQQEKLGNGLGVTVALLDTGVAASHQALQGRVKESAVIDLSIGEVELQETSVDTDPDSHGTHVAGLICGQRIGVAPEADLVSVVALPRGRGTLLGLINSLMWVQAKPEVPVINFSGGIDSRNFDSLVEARDAKVLIQDILSLGQLLIAAIGNNGEDFHEFPGNQRGVVGAGASTRENKIASFSGGATLLEPDRTLYTVPKLVAPGELVYSCVTNGYEALSGTSMAAPIVTGIAALMLEKYPNMSPVELRGRLSEICQDLGAPRYRQGDGLVNMGKAR